MAAPEPHAGGLLPKRYAFVFALAVGVFWAGAGFSLETFSTARLAIASQGRIHEFSVELALTQGQRAQGLMWRRRLDPDRGMLFIYSKNQVIRMWMKNTLIPLDMLFIDARGKVVNIKERAVPRSLRAISSEHRARAVLELRGGTVARLGLGIGDRVLHEAFGTR